MIRTSFLFFLLISFGSCDRPEAIFSKYPNGNVHEQFSFDSFFTKDTTGLLEVFFIDGKLKVTGRLKNGKRDGNWTEYNLHGDTVWKATYESGILNGEFFEKDKNGSWFKTNYAKGIKEGKSTEFIVWKSDKNKTSFFYQFGQYSNDKPKGLWVRKDTNGIILAENTYVDGIIRGYFTNRYENGKIKLKGELNIDSVGTNKFDFYDSAGNKTKLNSYEIYLVEP
jgi:antitoxin component YwqK of YwqJK toxin-antitoxin module